MKIPESTIENIDRKPCGCVLTEFHGGRKLFAPCIPCGLMRAGYALAQAGNTCLPWRRRRALLEAGNALAAVATTIKAAAHQANAVNTAVENILGAEDS